MCRRVLNRNGLSLAETLMATVVLSYISLAIGMLSLGVQNASLRNENFGECSRHGRVALLRIDRAVRAATYSEQFPGVLVLPRTSDSYSFPDTLVVWRPTGTAVDPNGVPRANELVIFQCDATNPNILYEIRNPSETASVTFPASNVASWTTLINTLVGRSNAVKVVVSNLVRRAKVTNASIARGCIAFRYLSAPTDTEIANYRASTVTFDSLNWPLNMRSASIGMRNVTVYYDIQFAPAGSAINSAEMLPLFGSTSIMKGVAR